MNNGPKPVNSITGIKRYPILAVLAMSSMFGIQPAHAGIPVIDVASLIQTILSVLNQITSITNQIDQITNQVDHIKAVTGSRNLGEVLNSTALNNYLPENLTATYDSLQDGYGSLSGLAKTLRDNKMSYNCADKAGAAQKSCQEMLAKPYAEIAAMKTALEATDGRLTQIKGLMSQINGTADEKGAAEINARIGAETSMLLHEMSRAQLTQGMFQAEARAEQSRQEEKRMEKLNRTGNVIDDIVL